MQTVKSFQAQQQADFWRAKAAEAQHQANFVQQSYHAHGAPVTAQSQVGGVYGPKPAVSIRQAAGRNLGHFNALNQQPGQTAHVPAGVKAHFEAQRHAQAQQAQQQQAAEIAALAHSVRAAVANTLQAVRSGVQAAKSEAQAGQVVQRFPGGSTLRKMSPGQASRIGQGLDPGPNQAQAQALKAQSRAGLPISPISGEPSSITAICNKSVGL